MDRIIIQIFFYKPKVSYPSVVFVTFSFGEITLSILIMITTHLGYEDSETMSIYPVGFHIYIKSVFNIIRCSTEILSLHFFLKTRIPEYYRISNLTKLVFSIFKNVIQNKYLSILKVFMRGWHTIFNFPSQLRIKFVFLFALSYFSFK